MNDYKLVPMNKIYNVDSRNILDILDGDVHIQTTITSPPYFDMKDYGVADQIGFGQSYTDYLSDLKSIFSGLLQKTKVDGSLWVIIDTFKRQNNVVLLPFDLARELQSVGWYLQDIIIWKKDKTVPWSTKGFSQRKFEYILLFSKSPKFKYNIDAVRLCDTSQLKEWWVNYPERYNPKGKALDELWEFPIPVQGSWGDKYVRHFCPLPKELVSRIIAISTDEDDVVFDPFAGSGTVLSQSAYMNRKYIGFELNPEYIEMFKRYLSQTIELGRSEYELSKNRDVQADFEDTIINLRVLKYAKLILVSLKKANVEANIKAFAEILGESNLKHKIVRAKYTLVYNDVEVIKHVKSVIETNVNQPPFSKFGIEALFEYKPTMDFAQHRDLYGYSINNSHQFVNNADLNSESIRILSQIKVDIANN